MKRLQRGDRGDTLLEIVISIAIMGIVITAVLGCLSTGLLAASGHALITKRDVAARNAEDNLASQPFATCGPYSAPPSGGPVTVEYWDKSAAAFVTTCPSPTASPYDELQRLTVKITTTPSADVTVYRRDG